MASPSRILTTLALAALALSACSNKNVKKPAATTPTSAQETASTTAAPATSAPTVTSEPGNSSMTVVGEPATPAAPDDNEADVRGGDYSAQAEIASIYFDYDRYTLSNTARQVLAKNASYLKKHASLEIMVAGNCDNRGTIEYNLALGEKRAKVVREYYARLGIPGKRLSTISYGKEKPVCGDATEACWSKNRRADTTVRGQAATAPAAPAAAADGDSNPDTTTDSAAPGIEQAQ